MAGGNGGQNGGNPFQINNLPSPTPKPKPAATPDPLASIPMLTPNPAGAAAAPLVAPISSGETDILNNLTSSLAPGGNPTTDAANTEVQNTLNGNYLTPGSNPFLQAAIEAAQRPVQQNFERVVVPQLLSRFTAAGQQVQGSGSSPFAQAAAQSSTDLGQQLADIGTNMAYQNYASERANQQGAVGQASNLTSSGIQNMIQGLQAAALPRLIQDMGITRGIDEFNKRVQTMLQALQIAAGVSVPTPATTSVGSSSSDQKTGVLPAIGQFVGGFTGGA